MYLPARGAMRPRAGCRALATPSPLLPYHEADESPKPGLDLLPVAPCNRLALLGIRHLCIDCSCTTTTTEGVSRQVLLNELL